MEAQYSDPNTAQDGVNRIVREIQSDAEKILSHPVQNTYPKCDSQAPLLEGDTVEGFVTYPPLPSVTSPLSSSSMASPMQVVDSAIQYPNTETSNGWLPSPGPTAQLLIIEQPVERCRFRYKAEHSPHGALRGADRRQKSCPKVKIENIQGRGYVMASLYTNEETPRRHINELWGWSNNCVSGRCRVELDGNMCATFSNLGIMRQKENDVCELLYQKYIQEYNEQGLPVTEDIKENLREKAQRETATMKDCLHCVRLGFQAFIIDEVTGREHVTPIVLSGPICNSQNTGYSELKIAEIDKSCGHAVGGDRIWLRCAAKIRRGMKPVVHQMPRPLRTTGFSDQIKVIFHEPNTRWEAEGVFSASDVYEQILIIFKTPAYHDINITERVHVNLHLLRTSDNTYSPPVDFVYLPVDDGPSAKRPRRTVPAFGPSGFGYFPDQSPAFSESSQSTPSYAPSAEYGAYTPGTTTRQHRMPSSAQHGRVSGPTVGDPESGIGMETFSQPSSSTEDPMISIGSLKDVRSRIESLSLAELNRIGATGETGKLQAYLTELWSTHHKALLNFSQEGDPGAFVYACKGLIGLQDEYGNTALHAAVKNKQSFALKTMLKVIETMTSKAEIIDQRNYKKQTALHLAIRFGDDDCVHYLITAGADRTAIDSEGQSMAHYLAETFNEDIYRDILFPPNETASSKQKVDLTSVNDEGITAVHLAIKRKKLALLEALLEGGASISDIERNTGKSALHLAVEMNDVDAVELLLKTDIPVDTQSYDGTTALQLAAKMRLAPIAAKLVAAGADPNEKTSSMAVITENKADNQEGENTEMEEEEEEESEEVLEGEGVELHNAFDFAGDDQIVLDILNGKEYVPPLGSQSSLNGAVGGARPKTGPYLPSTSSKHSLTLPTGHSPQRSASAASGGDGTNDRAVAWAARGRRVASRSSSGSPEPLPAMIQDDLSTLDYVTRIRLSKHLDENGQWEEVARTLNCGEEMIMNLQVCVAADNASPTVLLLDQLEYTPGCTITTLLSALRERGHRSAVEMIIRKMKQQHTEKGHSGD